MIDDDPTDEVRANGRPRSAVPWLLAAVFLAFAAGLVLSPWFETNVRTRLPGALHRPDVGALASRVEREASAIAALDARVAALEARPAVTAPSAPTDNVPPALNDPVALAAGPLSDEQLTRFQARLESVERGQTQSTTRIDNLSAEIASLSGKVAQVGGDASRSIADATASAQKARGVLLVTAARRAAEQGQSLAVLAPALRRQFSGNDASAVEQLLAASQGAPTLPGLREGFERLRPRLVESAVPKPPETFWSRIRSGIASFIEVRDKGQAARQSGAEMRLDDMEARLAQGDVAGALLVMQRLPASTQALARQWRISAEAYANTYGALQQLEAGVLLDDADLPGLRTNGAAATESL